MKSSTLAVPSLAAALLIGSGSVAFAQEAELATVPEPPPIEVRVDCASSPERVVISNNTARPLKLKSVGSTFQKRAGEPYKVRRTLKPRKSVSYTFGTGKGKGKRLTGSFIFDNEAAREGVLVKTYKGNVKVKCSEGTNAPPEPEEPEGDVEIPGEPAVTGEPVDALDLLATLPVEPEVEDGYDRALFPHWIDTDGDGCDAREATMIAESLTPVTTAGRCDVEAGTWYSSFDGDVVTNPASIDVNHTVPLKEAWQSGARHWSAERREAYANDLLDERALRAMSSGANRDQGEADPSEWLPADREVACQFVTDWVAIKASWGLAVDELERDAIAATLDGCEDRSATVVPRETPAAS